MARGRLNRLSLHPLTPEEALRRALSAPPMNGTHRNGQSAKPTKSAKPARKKRTKPKT